ncbi:caspase family protein [Bradyrhizobium sp. 169]|uniref:caspase family protein n=1 Tax=Bradyrhizobium sp. 169 TaxID=2782640 RepID=UPI001FFACE13|nr:caspase family protein [Bradyrhizobium sp. 169]MCK1586914.1 caspase family protein [Bradyrhizobium sp. 169]
MSLSSSLEQVISDGHSARVALVIGNALYAKARELSNTEADARGLVTALSSLGFRSHVGEGSGYAELKPYLNQSMMEMKRLLADFSVAAQETEMAVIYYSGHGIEIDFRNYLVPVDAELGHVARIEYETVGLPEVIRATNGAEKLRLVILDACRDNPFVNRMKGLGKTVASVGIGPPSNAGRALTFYAATEGQIAQEGPEGGMSPFAFALKERLLERPPRELLRVLGRVTEDVRRATAGAQEPQFYGPPPGDEIYLAPGATLPPSESQLDIGRTPIKKVDPVSFPSPEPTPSRDGKLWRRNILSTALISIGSLGIFFAVYFFDIWRVQDTGGSSFFWASFAVFLCAGFAVTKKDAGLWVPIWFPVLMGSLGVLASYFITVPLTLALIPTVSGLTVNHPVLAFFIAVPTFVGCIVGIFQARIVKVAGILFTRLTTWLSNQSEA